MSASFDEQRRALKICKDANDISIGEYASALADLRRQQQVEAAAQELEEAASVEAGGAAAVCKISQKF